jgi:hypothetical protein
MKTFITALVSVVLLTALYFAVLLANSPWHPSLSPSDEASVPTLFLLIAFMVGGIAFIEADASRRASLRAARNSTQPANSR